MDFFGNDRENSFGIKKSDIGLTLGVGITINRFYFGIQHDFGLKNLRNEVCWSEKRVFKNGSTTLLIGFNFNKHQ